MDGKAFPVQPEAPGGAAGVELAAFHPALTAPAHIAGDGFALLLGEGGVDGGDELAAHIGGVDALALEADIFSGFFTTIFGPLFKNFLDFFKAETSDLDTACCVTPSASAISLSVFPSMQYCRSL